MYPIEATAWQLRHGARAIRGAGVEFRAWAPAVRALSVRLGGDRPREYPMSAAGDGDFAALVPGVSAGEDYTFVMPGGVERPDPVSRMQPFGVHGPSRVVDPADFAWTDRSWKGIPLRDYVIYELHTGAFTPEGTFDAAIPKLPYLRDLGVTAVELMPVAHFPGDRNWGYDCVSLYAPHTAYGGPEGLRRLVDASHREGLAVVLDVVYNHLGPEGNYLAEFGPFFTGRYRTPWGQAINFDGPGSEGVRRFFVENALYWLTEFHMDALRLDAIHGIFDSSGRHILAEIADAFHAQASLLGRAAWVTAESDLNEARVILPRERGGYGVDAQWHDDFHHSIHTVLTGRNKGYLQDFGSLAQLKKALTEGFVYDGCYSPYRGRQHGTSSKECGGEQLIAFTQNHDQVANASEGRRLGDLVTFEQQKLAATILLLAPFLPLLFMGQEYGEKAPFLYFTSHGDPGLAEAVRRGRLEEFASFGAEGVFADPQSPETFERSHLNWSLPSVPPHSELLRLYRDLLRLRKRHASLSNGAKHLTAVEYSEESRWMSIRRSPSPEALIVCNFAAAPQPVPVRCEGGRWTLALWSGAVEYAGPGGGQYGPAPRLQPENGAARVRIGPESAAVYLAE